MGKGSLMVLVVALLAGCGGSSSPTSITIPQVSGSYGVAILPDPSSCPQFVPPDFFADVMITKTGNRFATARFFVPSGGYVTSVEGSLTGTVEDRVSSSGAFVGRTLRFDEFHWVTSFADGARNEIRPLTMPSVELEVLEGSYAGYLTGVVEVRDGDGNTLTCTAADHYIVMSHRDTF